MEDEEGSACVRALPRASLPHAASGRLGERDWDGRDEPGWRALVSRRPVRRWLLAISAFNVAAKSCIFLLNGTYFMSVC